MKRNLLALAIPALLVAGAASANIEIYNKDGNSLSINGRAQGMNYITSTGNTDQGDQSNGRLGFTGRTIVSDDLAGYGRLEYQANAGDNSVKTRYAFAGLDFGNAGRLDYGQNDGITKRVTGYTDVLPEFGGDSSDFYLLSNRQAGLVTYSNDNLFGAVEGLNFALQYADKSPDEIIPDTDDKAKSYLLQDRAEFGGAFNYTLPGVGVGIGASYVMTSKSELAYAEKGKVYAVGLMYDGSQTVGAENGLYVGALYIQGKGMNNNPTNTLAANGFNYKVSGYEGVIKYSVPVGGSIITPSVAYIEHKAEATDGAEKKPVAKYFDVALQYDFNKNMSAIVDYKINQLKEDDVSVEALTKDTVAVGLTYQF